MKKIATLAAMLAVMFAPEAASAAGPGVWGPLQYLRTTDGLEVASLHAAKMCGGQVLLMGFNRGGANPYYQSVAGYVTPQTWKELVGPNGTSPVTKTIVRMNLPVQNPFNPANPTTYDLDICGMAAHDQDGNLKVSGTTYTHDTRYPGDNLLVVGFDYTLKFTFSTNTWTMGNRFVGTGQTGLNRRWYPTAIRMWDTTMRKTNILIVGGSEFVDPHRLYGGPLAYPNDSVEKDDGTLTNKLVIDHLHSSPDIRNETGYPHVIPQADGTEFTVGALGKPVHFDVKNKVVLETYARRPGPAEVLDPNDGASTTPLIMYAGNAGPYGNGSSITCGGKGGTAYESSCDVYDAGVRAWTTHLDMGVKRSWPSTKLLANGTVAIYGGIASDGSGGQEFVQIFDPATRALTTDTAMLGEKRGYHTNSLLLNDGNLLVCSGWARIVPADGSVIASEEASSCRGYWPGYFWELKPYITALPATVALGSTFTVNWTDMQNHRPLRASVGALLIGLGTDTHGFDSGQSSAELKIVAVNPIPNSPNNYTVTLQMPQPTAGQAVSDTGNVVRPGCYTIFLIDDQGTPSLGAPIKIM
jgi:hypothetical protein